MKQLKWHFRMFLGWRLLDIALNVFPASFAKVRFASLVVDICNKPNMDVWSEDIEQRIVREFGDSVQPILATAHEVRPKILYLVNLYSGQVQSSFDDADQLVAYLRRKHKAGTLMDEAAFNIFWGNQLSTESYWKSALST